jgi:hypothetical protein
MGLFDAFSADDETRKFEQGLKYQTGQIGQADNAINQNFQQARADLRTGQQAGLGYLQDANATARGDITGAQAMGQGMLQQGADTAAGFYGQALTPWQQLSGLGTQGVQDHYNLISNPDSVFDSELYKTREQDTINGLNREANSRGMLASGNNTIDIIDRMRTGGLDYFNTLANQYQPYFGMAQNAAQGQAGVLSNMAGMYDRLGQNQSGLAQWGGGQLSNLADQYGTNQSNLATGTASQLAGNRQTEGGLLSANRLTQGEAGNTMYGNQATAQAAADKYGWEALLAGLGGVTGGVSNYVGAGGRFT